MRGAGESARFCVAAGMSSSRDSSLHWLHGLNRSSSVASGRADLNSRLTKPTSYAASPPPPATSAPRSAAALEAAEATATAKQEAKRTRELTRIYNNFLRHKVFQIMRDICSQRHQSEYAFMMDADTAVNRTNLERFVTSLDSAAPLYTGLCRRRSTWANNNQRGVGGGPGILLSLALLDSVCPRLESCAPLRSLMDRLQFAGGDLMLAKCMEFLGHRCSLEKEIPYKDANGGESRATGASKQGLQQGKGSNKLDELFRRGPPWVYPPLSGGTILVATRRSAGAKAIEMYQRLTASGLPLSSVISFHRVRPSLRAHGVGKDPRCRVFAEYTRLESGPAHWSSRCLPSFVLLGTPKSGTTSLFNWMLQHPDMRAPVRKELHFWAPVLTPEKNCADREMCSLFQSRNADSSSAKKATWPLSKLMAGKLLSNYLELFPRIDPREFAITGEASPAYLYSPSVALFFESQLTSYVKLLLLLRDPAERTFSEFKNKRDLMVKGAPKAKEWVDGHARFGQLVSAMSQDTSGCTPLELYTACEPCVRFVTAPNPFWSDASEAHGTLTAPQLSANSTVRPSSLRSCVVPPVVWQSWYHLFLPRYMRQGRRLLIEFSDDMSGGADEMMKRVGDFIGLPVFNFSTNVAYNTEKKRGAFISKTLKNDSSRSSGKNVADAKSVAAERTTTADANMRFVEGLMRHSVGQLQRMLLSEAWSPHSQQWRRSLPTRWVERYLQPARVRAGRMAAASWGNPDKPQPHANARGDTLSAPHNGSGPRRRAGLAMRGRV